MGMGWHEWPLMVFTVLGQCVVGGFIVLGLALIFGGLSRGQQQRVHRSMFALWGLMALAFIASTLHLGSPMRAFNSLNRVGESALSNEIAAGSVFFAVAGFYWLLAILDKMPALLGKIWLVVAMMLGVVFVYAMCRVYSIDTVPTWDNIYTPLGFVLTVFIGGPMLGYLLLQWAGINGRAMLQLPMISVLALIISLASVIMQAASLPLIYSSVQQASQLIPDYGTLMVWRLVLLVLGLGCWICPLIRGRTPMTLGMIFAMLLIIVAELIGRGVFYGLHMTVGMT
ncbi:TPA: dimethyl sulfoxide reductase anchor subunit family protein [Yersinia enterocolitica]|uniref:dimethyl sulfoxide reductase anchor subunit family protein n=1 Tax=Yersinia enterocolitica TaxID=630 RepID=UPI00094BB925|nr:dimethyl sulfoxide reductase anchor subunit family protein [Yersinia enterocolitica]MBW5834668.1 dimethyl sulfoxide reductase anchor subunit family protein [Yersinia enterocolitica]MBX9486979.1 dimethyl sulfoxide reductase anchor subunit family protein [Yersinia enterocolitica]MBX9490912.1 dimethyl sulfoxide reductase anchor subunit family protein [Yersinia enterocolitica]HEI6852226.1 dimethyl sulfoxide reductase anchor subunit family protein [Yersinia enterocolitica]HEN3566370.1 dimethyl s